jgi:PAS domain S-box-containing protein
MLMLDSDGKILKCNSHTEETFGYAAGALNKRNISVLITSGQ